MKCIALLLAALLPLPLWAAEAAPADFAWTATLDTGPHQGLVRLPVPAGALARLQSQSAADLRVFDARGQAVPFALAAPPQAPAAARTRTAAVPALPLYASGGRTPPRGAVSVRLDDGGQGQSVWVQLDPRAATTADPAQRQRSALFDTRRQQGTVSGLAVQAVLPANMPVRITVSTSSDLATWTPVDVDGRLYRFDGAGAPSNDTLDLPEPLALANRYLRLDWADQDGVTVQSVTGLVAPARAAQAGPRVDLPPPQPDGPAARVWELGFATPLAALDLATPQANTLVPVRILGRNQPSEPWRSLGQTVLYRVGAPGQDNANAPVQLHGQATRWLRIEATHGGRLEGIPLAVRAVFAPLEIVFLAGTAGPYQLAAGRAETPPSALPLAMLAGTGAARPQDLPAARIGEVRERPPAPAPAWAAWLPAGTDGRTLMLWLVLAAGVALLGGVAFALLRQMNAAPK